ncbi:MAG: efflux RND transporter periplasmic adaptor subunit [Marinibacterium sp.]|nr:efflux RND transporter periplasmic adaptor subunit [Marinibacterium sp.]
MRLIPFITAIIVAVAMYGLVLERDRLLAFARSTPDTAQAEESETAPSEDTGDVVVADAVQPAAIGVVVLQSTAQTVDSAVVLRGQTRANRQVNVQAETSAIVISEPMRKGASVTKGDVLCKLDPGTRQASLAEARARLNEAQSRVPEAQAKLAEAEAKLAEAKVNYNAANKLIEGGHATETRLKSTEASVRAAEASVASATSGLDATQSGIEAAAAAVALAKREIDRLTITAPFDGLLESDAAELGSLLQPGALCATVIQLNPIKLVGYVPETEVNRVELGAMAGAKLASGRQVQGQVVFVSRSADPLTRTFEVEILVENSDRSIRDGQTAEILVRAQGAKAHFVPQSSLTLNNEGLLGVRIVDLSDTVRFQPVKVLRDQTDGIWISGPEDVADIIVVGQEFVTEGVRVTPTYQEAAQ